MKLVVLIAVPLGLALAAGLLADRLLGGGHLVPAGLATALCLAPALPTYLLADRVWFRRPDYGPLAVLVGTAIRMTTAVLGVFALQPLTRSLGISLERFAAWVTALYLITLAVESALLAHGALGRGRLGPDSSGKT